MEFFKGISKVRYEGAGTENPLEIARNKAMAAFELMEKLDVDYFCFHDRDIAPEGETLRESNARLDELTALLQDLMAQSGKLNVQEFGTFLSIPQPVWIEENAYAGQVKPYCAEAGAINAAGMTASLTECDGRWTLSLHIPASVAQADCRPVTTPRLGTPRLTEEPCENPDGTPVDFTRDFGGASRASVIPGPFARLKAGEQQIPVWENNNL